MANHWGNTRGKKLTEEHKRKISEGVKKAYALFCQKNQSNSKGRAETTPNNPSCPTTKQKKRDLND